MTKAVTRPPRRTQRRSGIYARCNYNRVLIEGEGECVRPVEVRRKTMTEIGIEAAYRRMSTEALVGKLLDAVAESDLFAAVLEE